MTAPFLPGDGWLSAHGGLLVSGGPDQLRLHELATGRTADASGKIAELLKQRLTTGTTDLMLEALAGTLPGDTGRLLTRVLGQAFTPLDRARLLRLAGYRQLWLELTGTCEEHCVHCYASAGPEVSTHLTAEVVDACLQDAAQLGFSRVQLTGGDPVAAPTFRQAVTQATDLGLQVEIFTHGMDLDDERLAFLKARGARVALSIYAAEPARHDAVTRTPGSHERTWQALQRALAAGVPVRVGVVALGQTSAELASLRSRLVDEGLPETAIQITDLRAAGRGRRLAAVAPVAAAEPVGHADADLAGRVCVTWQGTVVPCPFSRRRVLGRVPEQRLAQILSDPQPVQGGESEAWGQACAEMTCHACRVTTAWLGREAA